MSNSPSLLKATENHMGRGRLPILREAHYYPTEASAELDEKNFDGRPVVVGTCIRAAWYRHVGGFEGEAYSAYTQWIFMMGKCVEGALIENWKQMGVWLDNSVRFYNKENNISGELDVLLKNPETGQPYIVELKTFSGYEATKSILGNKSTKPSPKDQHLLQTLIYLDLHKHIFKLAKIVYINKAGDGNAEFDLELSKEGENTYPVVNGVTQRRFSMEMVYERFKKLDGYVKRKELPPRDYEMFWSDERIEAAYKAKEISKSKYEAWQKKNKSVGDWQCRYCRYSAECYGLGDQVDAEEETEEATSAE